MCKILNLKHWGIRAFQISKSVKMQKTTAIGLLLSETNGCCLLRTEKSGGSASDRSDGLHVETIPEKSPVARAKDLVWDQSTVL